MDLTEIALDQLRPHPRNSNVMPEPMLAKLAAHIERSDRYPPVIVRPLPGEGETPVYEILDGHHRVQALCRLGRATAGCVIWTVDDDEALLLLATLNRLEGQDDPRMRAALVAELAQRSSVQGMKTLAAQLPERAEQLKKLLTLARPAAPPRAPQAPADMPQAVHFFLTPDERRELEQRLRAIGPAPEAALMGLVRGEGQMR